MSPAVFRSGTASRGGSRWAWWATGLTGLALVLGLAQAWSNIERMDLAYELGRQQAMLEEKMSLADKLELERDSLLSAHRLRARAETMGLEPAGTGRIRVMETAPAAGGDEAGS